MTGAWTSPEAGDLTLVQVGWYCAGGHLNDHGERVGQSFRPDDPCAHGVPMYVLRRVDSDEQVPS